MERIVFYGKGGIGKSTTSTNISATLARMGKKVLHVGCDPKHDSTVALMDGQMIPAVTDQDYGETIRPEDIVSVSRTGVHCVEAGGPHAGVGCAGRGISRTLEIFDKASLLAPGRYDVTVFDVLGDVVCGGFAAPLRKEMGEKVVIVASEEVMSLYAANNIAKAVVNYASNGIVLAGMVLNLRDNSEDLAPIRRFAALLGTRVLGVVPRHPLIREAEYQKIPVVEHAPNSDIVEVFRNLTEAILAIKPSECVLPTPLSDHAFHAYTRYKFAEPPGGIGPDPTLSRRRIVAMAPGPGAPSTPAAPVVQVNGDERDLKAGILAVRMGKVPARVALDRLRKAWPTETRELQLADLVS